MNERLPSDCLVMFCVETALVTYQVELPPLAAAPEFFSPTRVVPAIKCPQPVVALAGKQSSPPVMPPWKRSQGRMNDCVSPVHAGRMLDQAAPALVQPLVHRLKPPLLLPSKNRKLVPVPTGSIRAEKPSPPRPICHVVGPVGLPEKVTELGPLS